MRSHLFTLVQSLSGHPQVLYVQKQQNVECCPNYKGQEMESSNLFKMEKRKGFGGLAKWKREFLIG